MRVRRAAVLRHLLAVRLNIWAQEVPAQELVRDSVTATLSRRMKELQVLWHGTAGAAPLPEELVQPPRYSVLQGVVLRQLAPNVERHIADHVVSGEQQLLRTAVAAALERRGVPKGSPIAAAAWSLLPLLASEAAGVPAP